MFGKKSGELPIPPAAREDPRAVELARVWAAGGKQHVSLTAGAWSDPAAWGIMLVDLARHVANHYSHEKGLARAEVLARIKKGFEVEWATPTSEVEGQ